MVTVRPTVRHNVGVQEIFIVGSLILPFVIILYGVYWAVRLAIRHERDRDRQGGP